MPKAISYEYEIKGIFQGDKDILKRVTRTCSKEEKDNYYKINKNPFLVTRSAGSLGVDIVAVRGEFSFPIEVKSSKKKTIRLSGSLQLKEQIRNFQRRCTIAGLFPIYAFRLKQIRGDSWRFLTFDLDENNLFGNLKYIYKKVKKAEKSRYGYYILRWDDGTPLNEFINNITRLISK